MHGMARNSKILPDSISVALKNLVKRISGGVLLALAVWAMYALVFFNPYLDGFAVASTFGAQSIMGQVVGFIRYGVGFVPALFLILCVARWGLAWLANWDENASPEYNFIKCFVAVCVGAAGFGLLMPSETFGGAIGYITAADLGGLIGVWGMLVGALCLGVFFILAAMLLHIKWGHIKSAAHMMWRGVRWILSVFHLVPGAQYSDEEVESDDEDELEEEAVEELNLWWWVIIMYMNCQIQHFLNCLILVKML